jgi:hypothetical protein
LITAGSTANKLAVLAIACEHRDLMPDCLAMSSRWARGIPFALVLAIAGVKVAALLQSTAKRLGGLSVADVIKRPDDQFLLYLRPFDTDDWSCPGFADSLALESQAVSGVAMGCSVAGNFPLA